MYLNGSWQFSQMINKNNTLQYFTLNKKMPLQYVYYHCYHHNSVLFISTLNHNKIDQRRTKK